MKRIYKFFTGLNKPLSRPICRDRWRLGPTNDWMRHCWVDISQLRLNWLSCKIFQWGFVEFRRRSKFEIGNLRIQFHRDPRWTWPVDAPPPWVFGSRRPTYAPPLRIQIVVQTNSTIDPWLRTKRMHVIMSRVKLTTVDAPSPKWKTCNYILIIIIIQLYI